MIDGPLAHFAVKRLKRNVWFLFDDRINKRARFGRSQQIAEDIQTVILTEHLPEPSGSKF